jgi:hypothetical protein
MTDSVNATLGLLVSVSDSLNKASDSLSEQILEVESALQRYKLGVEVWVNIEHWDVEVGGGLPPITRVLLLGYGKNSGKWGLLVSECCDDEPPSEGRVSFLRDAPRDTRLAAVGKLPDLLKELVQKATEVANDAASKAKIARQIAAGLAQMSPE